MGKHKPTLRYLEKKKTDLVKLFPLYQQQGIVRDLVEITRRIEKMRAEKKLKAMEVAL